MDVTKLQAASIIVGILVGVTVLAAFVWRLGGALYGFKAAQEEAKERLAALELQLKPNGHSAPEDRDKSLRDMLDLTHGIARDNREANEAHTRALEDNNQQIRQARTLAGEAAQEAAIARQEASDARRAVNKLAAEVDIYTNAVLTDRARIRQQLRDRGIDLPDDVGE